MGAHASEEVKHPAFARIDLTDEQKELMGDIDRVGSNVMFELDKLPPSRETSLAKTKWEESCFWAKTAVLRNKPNT